MILITLLVLGTDLAPRRLPACTVDGDCIISTFAGCCGSCCPPPPFAVSRAQDAAQRRRCAIVDCAAPRCGGSCVKQEPTTAFRAACQGGQCVAVRAALSPVCSSDADCRIDYSIGPNGCPGNPVAVPVTTPQQAQPPPRPLTKREGSPQFGLTPGGPTREPVACPAPPPARAACSGGRCVLVRQFEE